MKIDLLKKLKDQRFNSFFAHWSMTGPDETLFEHSKLVYEYSIYLVNKHLLKKIIEQLINDLVVINMNPKNYVIGKDLLWAIFFDTIIWHDLGKLNPNFQTKKPDQPFFKYEDNSLKKDHSKLGSLFYFIYYFKYVSSLDLSVEEKRFLIYYISKFTFSLRKHHAAKLSIEEFGYDKLFISDAFNKVDFDFLKVLPKEVADNIEALYKKNIDETKVNRTPFPLFALLKLNYSLLTASDYLATTHFMHQWPDVYRPDLGILNKKLKEKIIKSAKTTMKYNRKTYEELNTHEIKFPEERKNKNLNTLRQNLATETIKGIRQNTHKNLFYLEAPTGGGKTNLSMLALSEFLQADLEKKIDPITKVFYVFPFTTLITQTYKSVQETLNLDDEEIIQLHSKAGFKQKSPDGEYGSELNNYIDYLFVNYPITMMSHIRFFDILKSNRKESNYLLHRIANSVVIIDELQTYTPKEWDKIIYLIDQYSQYFNIKFILMSATLPKLHKLLSKDIFDANYKQPDFVYLNNNRNEYFTNPNFADRINFNFDLIEELKPYKQNEKEYLQKLKKSLIEKSLLYLECENSGRVHTIIEFIFKKTAGKFYALFKKDKDLFDEIFLLSGTILEPRRKEIINKLKSKKYESKSILLITTQVVEAGVDIDMDIGFKNRSLIDSDEQLAGRINRNVNKSNSILYLFDFDDASVIYGNDKRYEEIQNDLADEYQNILKTKSFDRVYEKVMEKKTQINTSDDYDNLKSYLSDMKKLNFDSVHKKLKLINSQNTSVYVPINIPVEIPNSNENNFEKDELEFLTAYNKYKKGDVYVSGEKVWELYEDIIKNKEPDFTQKKILMTKMQAILSKFSFSIFTYSKDFMKMAAHGVGEEKYGYYFLHHVEDGYDYQSGINTDNFPESIFF
jgi:CRISPR-associated endonuclease/helicase Cas3